MAKELTQKKIEVIARDFTSGNEKSEKRAESELRRAGISFPALLPYVRLYPDLVSDILYSCLIACQRGKCSLDDVTIYAPHLATTYTWLKRSFVEARVAGKDAEDDAFSYLRGTIGIQLDLMGYFPAEMVAPLLNDALQLNDPYLSMFAVISLLRLGESVQPIDIAVVAADAEMRNSLYDQLAELDKSYLFPAQYRTQEAFAESEMVRWLAYPTELGRAPDKTELMQVFSEKDGDDVLDFYLFRFMTEPPHHSADNGWMAGLAGPFIRSEAPSTTAHGFTFSKFDRWDSRAPKAHFQDIAELLRKHWQQYASDKKN